ncbi:MAG: RpiB/LacA/LacB family sugar-phosphate isomerase [Eubacteriales bacterium]|nr:RpiB/LacA/LacB family sugar-phosphate isomerase [Eubacteriales bacterium]
MKIAVINEVSASHRNADIIAALAKYDYEIYNLGMTNPDQKPELTYIHTGLMTGILLNAEVVDLVVGGCGTGQGFLNSAMQYPGVFCGLISDPLDAWLFSQINGGNCISLALNKGYGWAADTNLKFIFEKLFEPEMGSGYPEHRKESQRLSREKLKELSGYSHKGMNEILASTDREVLVRLAEARDFRSILENSKNGNEMLKYL